MGTGKGMFALYCVGAGAINEGIAARDYGEYRKVKNVLEKYGWDTRIIKPMLTSWCQRHAAKLAAEDAGYGDEINEFINTNDINGTICVILLFRGIVKNTPLGRHEYLDKQASGIVV